MSQKNGHSKINLKVDLEGLASQARHAANQIPETAEGAQAARKFFLEIAEALSQAFTVLSTLPQVIENKRQATVIETSINIANAMVMIADQFEEGERPPVPAWSALREFAGSLGAAVLGDPNAPPKKKSKLIGLH